MSRIFRGGAPEWICGARYPRGDEPLDRGAGRRPLVLYRAGEDGLVPASRRGLECRDEHRAGNSGDLQIELIQQRNDAPSMYKEFLDSGRRGSSISPIGRRRIRASTTARWRSATRSVMRARSAASRAASPISTRAFIPAPWSRFPTSAATRDDSSTMSAGPRRTGTAASRSAR